MSGLSPAERVECVEVAEILHNTMGSITKDGILVESVWGWNANGVRYADPSNPSEPVREMSATAYAAEFYKVCGGDLNEADFDTVIQRLLYIGKILGNGMADGVGFDTLKVLAASEQRSASALEYRGCR